MSTPHWQDTSIAPEGTHHLCHGRPLYAVRFQEVLKFHGPGLAPVRDDSGAYHIDVAGSPAYADRHVRTVGFYEDRAAVHGADGWFHIRPDGSALYAERYAWCGNFQGGRCSVRTEDGCYLHLNKNGAPAYVARYAYAGDHRDGIAVVLNPQGQHTHIDRDGNLLHGRWFVDLDVFHKGLARARDDQGWHHVDTRGEAVYARRFAAVEPFYNGQARVERFDGGLEVIDEDGQVVTELRPAQGSEFAALSSDLVGFWRSQTICAAVELGVFEALPGTADEIARACRLDPGRTGRLLRALAELRLARVDGDRWYPTRRGEYLIAGHPWSLAGAAMEFGRNFPRMWEALPTALRAASGWQPPDIFGEVASDPARAAAHHRMLMSYALHDYAALPAAIGLRGDERVVDAGGGLGALAESLLGVYPDLRVVVLDRPEVIELASRRGLPDRVALRSVDLFRPWGVEADVVVMARVLHDWDDPLTLSLLRHARRALPLGGRLFVVEMLLPEDGASGGLCDLHLLMATGGRERTASEFANLLGEAGFDMQGVRRLPAVPSIVMGVAR